MADPCAPEWRCFHCDEVFAERQTAQDHFGLDCLEVPTCIAIATEGERAILEDRRDWRTRALKAEAENEQISYELHLERYDTRYGPLKASSRADAERKFVEQRNALEAAQQALEAAGPLVAGFLRWLGEARACRASGHRIPKLSLYLP